MPSRSRRESPSARIESTLKEARDARERGAPAEALALLDGAAALLSTGPVRRELRVGIARERGLCHVAAGEATKAREALAHALEQAGGEGVLADPVRAELAMVALMADDPERSEADLAERGRDRRATLVARARLHLWQGATGLAEQALEGCEHAPGGTSSLGPPSAALRSLVAVWEGRPEQARLLLEGVMVSGNPYWELVRLLVFRSLWVGSGDGRYLQLALGIAEQLRFGRDGAVVPGLSAAASAQHALLLAVTGNLFLARQAADEAWAALGALTQPEWPRAAVLHDLAVVYRDAGDTEAWQRVLDAWSETPAALWAERMTMVTGPRAFGAVVPAAIGVERAREASSLLTEVALRVLEETRRPEATFVRGLVEAVGATGGRWTDRQDRTVAQVGAEPSGTERTPAARVGLPQGGTLLLWGVGPKVVADVDAEVLERVAEAARARAAMIAREGRLRDALEAAKGRAEEATGALERARRGPIAAVSGGRFPTVAGRSAAIRAVLDRMGLLLETRTPVLLEGAAGTGRRHLARAFAVAIGGSPERVPVLEMALVPDDTMVSTLGRLQAEAAGGPWIVAGAEHLSGRAASWLIDRAARSEGGRLLVTMDEACDSPVAVSIRQALGPGRVALPRLDERVEDVPDLIDAIARELGRRAEDIGTATRAVLARRLWPGNVAELRRLLVESSVRAGERAILPEHLEPDADAPAASLSEGLELGFHDAVQTYRNQLLQHALDTTAGNRTRAAELLGLQRTYFMRLIRDLDVPPAN